MASIEEPQAGSILIGDCGRRLQDFDASVFSLAVADIPYGIGLDEWDVLHENTNSALGGESPAQRAAGSVFARRGKPINGWSQADREIPRQYYEWCRTWADEILRTLKPGGSLFVFAGRRYAHRCISALEDSGFNFRDLIAWKRPAAAFRAQRMSKVFERRGNVEAAQEWEGWRLGNLRPVFEPIIWCAKPYRVTVTDNVLEHGVGAFNAEFLREDPGTLDNLFDVGYREGERGLHQAQKPVDLIKVLVGATTRPGDLVLDPFAGSGTTGVACVELDRPFVLIEADEQTALLASSRLNLEISHRGVKSLP